MASSLGSVHRRPAREQNLFISASKHLYALKNGSLKYQQKELDARTAADRSLLVRYVVLDVDTGAVYGEYHETSEQRDLAGFLARAWSAKPDNRMRGLPETLNVPKVAREDPEYAHDLGLVKSVTPVAIGDLPGGFGAGVHALRELERQVTRLFWQLPEPPTIAQIQALASVLSTSASSWSFFTPDERWFQVPPPPDSFFAAIDALYDEPGGWCSGPFALAVKGLPKKG